MVKHLDITIDLETCGLGTNAAPLQLAAVAWQRTTPATADHPFVSGIPDHLDKDDIISSTFNVAIDLRDCFFSGLEIDRDTQQFWLGQKQAARDAVLNASIPYPLPEALAQFSIWVNDIRNATQADSFTLWAQGSDFDIAKLREYYKRCGMKEPFTHHEVRCARTFILEHAPLFMSADQALRSPKDVYKHLPALPDGICDSVTHDALYDCYKTSWAVWQIYRIYLTFVNLNKAKAAGDPISN